MSHGGPTARSSPQQIGGPTVNTFTVSRPLWVFFLGALFWMVFERAKEVYESKSSALMGVASSFFSFLHQLLLGRTGRRRRRLLLSPHLYEAKGQRLHSSSQSLVTAGLLPSIKLVTQLFFESPLQGRKKETHLHP